MKKNIHVIYLITKLECGGAQKVCLSLFDAFNQEEHFSSSLISGSKGYFVDSVKHKPNVYLLDSLTREVRLFSFLKEFKAFFDIIRVIRKIKRQHPHVIMHTHSTKAGIIGRWAAFFAGVRTRIHTVHGYGFHDHQRGYLWWPLYLIELCTNIITTHAICVSSSDVKQGIKLFRNFYKKNSIIRAAVEWDKFYIPTQKTELSSKTPFIIGTIACFKPQKNLFDLLQAFEYAFRKNDSLRLEIIGDGILRPKIESWIKAHKLESVITLHGWQQDVSTFMKRWHAFSLSSLWEGLPCAIIEARLQKLPVIAYNTGGIHDVIFTEENGLLFKQKDWQGLAHGFLMMSANPTLYKKFSNNHDHLDEFKTEFMAKKHKHLYSNYF